VRSNEEKRQEAAAAMADALPEPEQVEGESSEPVSTILDELGGVEGLDIQIAASLAAAGFPNAKSLYNATVEQLLGAEGMSKELAFRLIDTVQERFDG